MPSSPFRLSILALTFLLATAPLTAPEYATAAIVEICDNCVDDDGDQIIDRADADCNAPVANGGFAGIGDPTRGKAILKCHKGIEKAGLAFSSKRLKRLYGCVTPIFACVQTKNGDAVCLQKAGAKCAGTFAGGAADEAKLRVLISKACDPALVSHADLDLAIGLGLGAEEAACLNEGNPIDESIGSFAECILQQHVCHVNRGLSIGVPRSRELLLAVGRDPDTELACLDPGSDGAGQRLGPDLGKVALKCQKDIVKASLKLGASVAKSLQKCFDLGVACLQVKGGDPACLGAAQDKCAKLSDKLQNQQTGLLAKILASASENCDRLLNIEFNSGEGLGFGAQAARCDALGVPRFGVRGPIACAGVQQFCEAKQMLQREVPRLEEFFQLLNVVIVGL